MSDTTPTPETAHGMVPGSHERPGGSDCICGAPWSYWDNMCAQQLPRSTPAPSPEAGPVKQCGCDTGRRPYWMSIDQYDPCPCVLPGGHDGPHECAGHGETDAHAPALSPGAGLIARMAEIPARIAALTAERDEALGKVARVEADDPLTRVRALACYWANEAERVRGTGLYDQYRSRSEFLTNTLIGAHDGYWPNDDELAALAGES